MASIAADLPQEEESAAAVHSNKGRTGVLAVAVRVALAAAGQLLWVEVKQRLQQPTQPLPSSRSRLLFCVGTISCMVRRPTNAARQLHADGRGN